jgi:hypothetical protein
MLWLLLPPLYKKSGGRAISAAYVKKALAMSQPIFKLKSPILSSQGRFLWKDKSPDSAGATFNGGKGVKMIHQPSYSPNTAMADVFLFQRGEVKNGRPLVVPGQPDGTKKPRKIACRYMYSLLSLMVSLG